MDYTKTMTEEELDMAVARIIREAYGYASLDELIETKVEQKLAERVRGERKISNGWLKLRKEINYYIREEMTERTGQSYATCQNAIYNPIKITLGVNRIDDMTDYQAKVARRVFIFIKEMTGIHNQTA